MQELQEIITKFTVDSDYKGSVSKDLELVKQIDTLKQSHVEERG